MILVRQRRSEQCHDPIAHDLIDCAFIVMNRFHHMREDGIDDLPRFLGIAVGKQLHRAFHVGEQNSDVLALAFQRRLRADDLLGEIFRDVGFRQVEMRCGGVSRPRLARRMTALRAELGTSRKL